MALLGPWLEAQISHKYTLLVPWLEGPGPPQPGPWPRVVRVLPLETPRQRNVKGYSATDELRPAARRDQLPRTWPAFRGWPSGAGCGQSWPKLAIWCQSWPFGAKVANLINWDHFGTKVANLVQLGPFWYQKCQNWTTGAPPGPLGFCTNFRKRVSKPPRCTASPPMRI